MGIAGRAPRALGHFVPSAPHRLPVVRCSADDFPVRPDGGLDERSPADSLSARRRHLEWSGGVRGDGSLWRGVSARRNLNWACWSQAAAEVSWLCVTLSLVTGSLWARNAWGVWWTWEPRLTSAFVLWLILAGTFLARAGTEDLHLRARTSAVLAILAVCDIPIIVMAARWFRGMHPVAPQMDPRSAPGVNRGVPEFCYLLCFSHPATAQATWLGRAGRPARQRKRICRDRGGKVVPLFSFTLEMNSMAAMIAAYLIGWATVSAYVAWLSLENRRLARRLDELEALLPPPGKTT